MIGSLTGEIRYLEAPTVILDVNGVGYEVDTPLSSFCQLKKGDKTTLWTHLVVREDAQQLYGFIDLQDKQVFRVLLKVSGIGAKMALGILSGLSIERLVQALEQEDIGTLTKIPGVGKKTAERMIIELRGKFKHLNTNSQPSGLNPPERLQFLAHSPITEAEAALVSLGYKPAEAQKAIHKIKHQHDNSADLIRAALKSMMK